MSAVLTPAHEPMTFAVLANNGLDRNAAAAAAALENIGWTALAADMNLATGTMRVELRRADGLTVTLDRDAIGRCSLTRERLVNYVATVGRRGDRCPVDRLRHEFIGRDCIVGGPRTALRALANYVGDNAIAGADRIAGRAAVALLMDPFRGEASDAIAHEDLERIQ